MVLHGNLEMRRKMFKQKHIVEIVSNRNVYTKAHDAILYITCKPKSERYKNNVSYKGAIIAWNSVSVKSRFG